jgi:hypothetical protein
LRSGTTTTTTAGTTTAGTTATTRRFPAIFVVKLVSMTRTQQDNLKENVDNMRRHTQQHETCKVQDVLPFPQEKHFLDVEVRVFGKWALGQTIY